MWRGIAIGVMISAPMGPVGMLCIQRTLTKGRMTGLYTGIGAAVSDIIYCLLTGFGLSFIEDFLTRNQNIIQLLGSVVLIGFAVYLARKNPAASLHRPVGGDTASPRKDILGGFLFTFSNPLILFLIVGLFARFNFLGADLRWYNYILGYIAIAGGALGWWWMVTFFVDKVRSHFNLRSMWLVNRIISAVILLFGVVGLITSVSAMAGAETHIPPRPSMTVCANSSRGFAAMRTEPGESARPDDGEPMRLDATGKNGPSRAIVDYGTPAASFSVCWRLKVSGRSSRGEACRWRVTLAHGAESDGISVLEFGGEEIFGAGDLDTRRVMTMLWMPDGSRSGAVPMTLREAGAWSDETYFRLTYSPAGIWLTATMRSGAEPVALPSGEGMPAVSSLEFEALGSTRLEMDWLSLELPPADMPVPYAPQAADSTATCGLAGIWYVADRNMDEDLLRSGGDYRLRLRETDNGVIVIEYLEGAVTYAGRWKPGMVKGVLTPSPAEDIYSLTWIDAEGKPMSHELTGAFDRDEMTLTLGFPYQKSTLRLKRLTEERR